MKTCELEKIVNELMSKNVAFSLMAITNDGDGDCDQYYCSGNDRQETRKVIEATIADLAMQIFDSGNKINEVKAFFETIIDEAHVYYNESKSEKLS